MASEQDDPVFDDLENDVDDDQSSQSQDVEDDLENDDVLPEEDEDDDEEDLRSISPGAASPPTTSAPSVPVAVPSASAVTIAAVPNGADHRHQPIVSHPTTTLSPPDPKRQRVPPYETIILPQQLDRKPQPIDETRRLFQRLWTDEDEIELLQGFLDYTTQRGGGAAHHDTALFYDQIKSKLQLDFNKNQLVEKLRRLKKKYRNVVSKISSGKEFSFKSPHDQATFEISKKIWSSDSGGKIGDGNLDDEDGEVKLLDDQQHQQRLTSIPTSRKRSRSRSGGAGVVGPTPASTPTPAPLRAPLGGVKIEDNHISVANDNNNNRSSHSGGNGVGANANISGMIEETVRCCLSPLFKELLGGAVAASASSSTGMFGSGRGMGVGGLVMNAMPLGFGFGGGEITMVADEKWRKQQILELEVYSKRLELVQDQIRVQLDELRSLGGGGSGGR